MQITYYHYYYPLNMCLVRLTKILKSDSTVSTGLDVSIIQFMGTKGLETSNAAIRDI